MANELMQRNDWFEDPFFDNFGRRMFERLMPTASTNQVLKTDLTENEQAYLAKIDVPGIAKDELKLAYQDDVLSISVQKHSFSDHEDKEGNRLMSERRYGTMSRSYRLPNVDEQKIKASYTDGVLTVMLPKRSELPENSHQITID